MIDENQNESDREIPADIRTSRILVEIGNGVCEFIKLTVDSPSMNESGWMPLLDLQCMVKNNQILYKFFKKSMSSKYVMVQNSAMPMKIKRNALVQEVIRRLRNTSRSLSWSVKAEILSEFSMSMKMSGWSEKFRFETIQSGVLGFERQCRVSDAGGRPMYRPRSYEAEERRRKKALTKTSWYRPADAALFIPATPGEELKKNIERVVKEELERIGMSAKVVETGGVTMRSMLVRTDLTGCIAPACVLCASGLKGGSHTRRGAVYTGHCSLCGENNLVSEYHGETGDSAYARMETHKQDMEGKKDSNAFHKHLELNHPEHIQDLGVFKMKVEKTFSKPLDRQIFEGTLIAENERRDHLLNSKMQFHEPSVPRVTVTRQLGN